MGAEDVYFSFLFCKNTVLHPLAFFSFTCFFFNLFLLVGG